MQCDRARMVFDSLVRFMHGVLFQGGGAGDDPFALRLAALAGSLQGIPIGEAISSWPWSREQNVTMCRPQVSTYRRRGSA